MQNPTPAPHTPGQRRNRGARNNRSQPSHDSGAPDDFSETREAGTLETMREYLFNQNPFGLVFMCISLVVFLIPAVPYLLAGIYTFLAGLSLALWALYDFVFGTRLVSGFPPLMGMMWGAVFGACIAFWLSAPLYGWRKKRALIVLVPLVLMLVSAAVVAAKKPLPTQSTLVQPANNTANNTATTNAIAPALSSR